jgi:hypothetical protein
MRIGIPDMNVPKTGINQKTRTIRESVKIYGNTVPPWRKLIRSSPIDVSTALVIAMRDCAFTIAPNPLVIFWAMTAYSV